MPTFTLISNVRSELKRRNAMRRFLAVTDRSKEALFILFQFLIACAVIAYFLAHFIVYLVSEKYPAQQAYIHNHNVVAIKK